MKPSPWPDQIDHLLAKSVQHGGETLADHTWDVLSRLADLYRLRPTLGQGTRLWHCLYWATFLHDFGKAACGFQRRLRGGPSWKHRHEVLSLAFVDAIRDGFTDEALRWLVAAIVSHHRDEPEIAELYPPLALRNDPLATLVGELDQATIDLLLDWLNNCGNAWIAQLGLSAVVDPIQIQSVQVSAQSVRKWLNLYHNWVRNLAQSNVGDRKPGILLRGLITTADHMASAHVRRLPPPVAQPWLDLAQRLRLTHIIYDHQQRSADCSGQSALLMAPTGSGKTEAALYWALGSGSDQPARIFYVLPYQASMNAMYDRLRRYFTDKAVGLQHGRAAQALYARFRDSEEWSAGAMRRAQWEKNLNLLHARPIKVLSPYQLLKALFQLRGFEAMLTDCAQAAFIFDEIHAYEPERLALITGLIRYLRERFAARFFVMSATFPQLIRDRLQSALGDIPILSAAPDLYDQFKRHRLWLRDGELTAQETVEEIVAAVQSGKQVLVCANTVARAQEMRDRLAQTGLANEQLLLIHSRFIYRDRNQLEQQIMAACGKDAQQRPPLALVATQVVEVSLDIDLDTIYTDPAPLEALLQRFGRVNRRGAKGICPVYVFRQPEDGQGVYGRDRRNREQSGHIVRVTLAELEQHNGQVIDEAAINQWLDRIYADPTLQQQWTEAYQRMTKQVELIIGGLCPFRSDEQREDEFEQMFDSVEVIPACFERSYIDCIVEERYIEANDYLVSISKQRFAILRSKGKVRPAEETGSRRVWVAQLPYESRNGLSFDDLATDPDWS
ncbi:CRISPR-associated helicase Cas3' [Chloroflexus sp.]|uniref:CRISPR-associated helicase Cas3' n=1 Tax=Chloroflexus sp. TaxID=1904827 RepID=UPI002626F3E4|nr:CRISPR-associated helicase Cas3' [uncultured Chloroflexus sp.]